MRLQEAIRQMVDEGFNVEFYKPDDTEMYISCTISKPFGGDKYHGRGLEAPAAFEEARKKPPVRNGVGSWFDHHSAIVAAQQMQVDGTITPQLKKWMDEEGLATAVSRFSNGYKCYIRGRPELSSDKVKSAYCVERIGATPEEAVEAAMDALREARCKVLARDLEGLWDCEEDGVVWIVKVPCIPRVTELPREDQEMLVKMLIDEDDWRNGRRVLAKAFGSGPEEFANSNITMQEKKSPIYETACTASGFFRDQVIEEVGQEEERSKMLKKPKFDPAEYPQRCRCGAAYTGGGGACECTNPGCEWFDSRRLG